jgi:uncharacterized membrane protein (DUF2068 family)
MKPPAKPSHVSTATRSAAIRTIALFEAFKGTVVLLAASGLLSLIHKDVQAISAKFIEHMHLNPASHYPSIFLVATSHLHDKRLVFLAAGAGVYALVRFLVAYGLYAEKAWAEVLTAVSGAIYVPFEVAKLVRMPTWHSAIFLTVNLLIVTFMVVVLFQRRKNTVHSTA